MALCAGDAFWAVERVFDRLEVVGTDSVVSWVGVSGVEDADMSDADGAM